MTHPDPRKAQMGRRDLSKTHPVRRKCRCERPMLMYEKDMYGVRVLCFKCGMRP